MSTSNNIIWLHGPPGCGKSTISLTLAEHFNSTLRLGAYLYLNDSCYDPSSVIATIASKLACFDSTLGKIISDHVESHHGGLSVKTQFREFCVLCLTVMYCDDYLKASYERNNLYASQPGGNSVGWMTPRRLVFS